MPKIQNIETAYQKKHYWSYHEAQTRRQKSTSQKHPYQKSIWQKKAHTTKGHTIFISHDELFF